MFAERGFDDVTVEEISRAVGVSHMTFFRHFPTKEAVLLDDPYDPVIGEAVSAQDNALPALEQVRRGFLEAWESLDEPGDAATRVRLRLAAGNTRLRAKLWENNHATEEVVVGALVAGGVPPLEARVATGAVLGALTAALFDWANDPNVGALGDRVLAALNQLEVASPRVVT
jgi:AcrR family transcriptional regulator